MKMKKSKWRRLVSLLLVLSVVASLVLAAVPGVSARATGVQGSTAINSTGEGWLCDGVYEIYSVANMQYAWDINGASTIDGGNLTVYPANHSGAQRFVVQRLNSDAYYSIRNLHSNKYIDLKNGGTDVQQCGDDANHENRRWVICYAGKVTINGETYETFAIKSNKSGKYVTVAGNNIFNSANIEATATDTNSMYTRWIFKPVNVKSGEFYLRSKINNNFSVDIPSSNAENGANVQLWSANTSNAQRFTITPTKDGYATITAFCSGRFICSEYAGADEGTNLIQYGSYNEGSFSANTKWAVIPNTDGSYSFCNYDNGLYLDVENGTMKDGTNIKCWYNNGGNAQRWNLVSPSYAKGNRGNAQTGVVPESFNSKDVIRLPIKIYDYKADGMLFEYAESPTGPNNSEVPGNNRGFGMLRSSNYSNSGIWSETTPSLYYKTTHTGYCPEAPNVLKYVGKVYNNYGSGASNLDSTYPGAYDNITYVSTYQTNGAAIDYTGVISEKLGYTLYNRLTDGIATVGLVQPTLDSATGNPVYTPQAVEYIAHLLYTTLKIPENRNGYDCYNYVDGEKRLEYNPNNAETLAIALRFELTRRNPVNINNQNIADYTNKNCYRLGSYEDTMTRAANLKGSFRDVRGNIQTCFDAAYYLLNNLFDEKGYHLYDGDNDRTGDIAPYDYLELTSVTTASGKQGYIFDAAFTNTTNVGSAASAVQYQDRVIRNTSANAKTQYCYSGDGSGYLTSMYPFLPVTGMNNSSGRTVSPNRADDGTTSEDVLGATYKNRDYNYVLKSSGEFIYNADDNLFFDFEGDDDVYLFINGQLVLDIGGAHSITKVEMNLNDYVRAARAKVAAGSATDRDRALALVDGQTYDFDFFYMERHGYGANMRVFTNIKVTDKSSKTVKSAYQNGEALNEGATVVENVPIEYSFSLTNQSAYNLTRLTFDDHDLAVSIRYDTGLTVNDTENIKDANGETLDASDVIIQYTNQSGYTATKTFENNDALKTYLTNLVLKPKETLTVRGVWLQSITPKLSGNKFLNTVYTSAQTESGSPIYGSDDMWLFIPAEPSYYEWAGHDLSIAATKIITDVKKAAEESEDKENHPLYGRTNGLTTSNFSKIEVCTAGGTVISSNNLKISGSGTSSALVVNYPKVGSYTAYVKVTYGSNTDKNNATLVLPVQIYVTNVQDSVLVLDYGLKADLGEVMNKTDTLTVPGRSTSYKYEATTTSVPFYSENHIILPTAENAEFNGVFEVHSAANDNIIWELPVNLDGTRVIQSWTNSYTANSKLFYIYPDTLHPGYYRIMSYSKATYLTRIHDNNLPNAIDKDGNPRNEYGYVALTSYSAEETGQYWKITRNADGTVSFTSRFDETVQGRTPYQLTLLNADGTAFNGTNENPVNFLRAWKDPNSVDAKYRSFKLVATVAPIARTSYGNYVPNELSDKNVTLDYQPTKFMEGADSVYAAVRVYEGTASGAIGTVNINTEVEMYKKITVLPANVVYYEDDFPAITYYGNSDGKTANTFTTDGNGSGTLYQSADQSMQYGFDDTYGTGTTMSGNSGHVIKIYDTKVAAEFTFVGTGFELIGRSMVTDKGVMYLDVLNESGGLVKRIPVILEYEDTGVTSQTEGIYQVPIVRVDGLTHGKYKVQIYGVPAYQKDANGNYIKDENGKYVVETKPDKAPTLFIDGVRIYNPLADTDANREYYIDGEDTAKFLEIRNLILTGKAAVVSFEEDETTGALELTTNTSTYTENRNGVTYPVNTYQINSVAQSGYFVDAETKTGATDYPPINLRTDATVLGNNQFVFTFAKTENNTDYYYIHINSGGHERYLKRSAVTGNANIMLVSKEDQDPATKDPDCFLWKITSLDKAQNIVTIQSKYDSSYLSVATVDASAKTGTIQAVSTGTIADAQKWKLGAIASQTVFKGNVVNSVNDYLVFGPNNELYLDGVEKNQALAFYFTPDGNTTTTTMLQVGVHVLNDQRLIGGSGDLVESGALYQSAYSDGITGWKALDEKIQTSTERYYPIDLSLCKYDEALNRYEVVLYCGGGYLSFTNLKVSGGTIETITGETADLRYNNGVLELLTTVGVANTRTWVPVEHPESYPDFASLTKQMSSTTMFEFDADTGEFVPALIESDAKVALAGRSLLFKDIIKMRFYFDISATGVTTASPENSGLLVWSEEEYAALDTHTVDTAGKKIRGLTHSVNGYYADTQGIPAKNMVDKLYVRAYVILPDGSYEYSDITEFSPVMYAQIILEKESSSETMKELVIALMNYGAAAQKRFNYKTDNLMNAWLPAEQQTVAWSDEWINALPTDTSKVTFEANDQITMVGSSVTFVGAVNQNFYFNIPAELTQNATKIELLYWTASEYEEMTELTVANAHHVDYDPANGRAVIEGTAAKNLGNSFYLVMHIVNEEGDVFSTLFLDSAHDYARRVLASASTSDAMKELAQTLVIYSNKAKAQLGG